MEFFNVSFFTGFFAACGLFAFALFLLEMSKKLQPQHETPKVGTNKQAKEGCPTCTHFLHSSDKCWTCGEDYKHHQPG